MDALDVAKLSTIDRTKKIKDIEKELQACRTEIKVCNIKRTKLAPTERRIDYLLEEIASIKNTAARKIALLEGQIEEIRKENDTFPRIVKQNKERIKELEADLVLLNSGKELKELVKLLGK